MTQIHIDIPYYFDTQLFALLFVIYRRSSNYTIKFRHKVVPVSTFEQSKSRVIKSLNLLSWGLLLKFNSEILFSLFKPCLSVFNCICEVLWAKFYSFYLSLVNDVNKLFHYAAIYQHSYNFVAHIQSFPFLFTNHVSCEKTVAYFMV